MRIAFIDHYDSFSFNVLDWLRKAGSSDLEIQRITVDDQTGLARLKNNAIPTVISPGPGRPEDYPRTLNLVETIMGKVPILGICLGHQMLGLIAGGQVIRAIAPWHGTSSRIKRLKSNWLTQSLPDEFDAICYNSLVVKLEESTPDWEILAVNEHQENMMMSHRHLPVASVQFHPESFGSRHGDIIAKNFLKLAEKSVER